MLDKASGVLHLEFCFSVQGLRWLNDPWPETHLLLETRVSLQGSCHGGRFLTEKSI